MSEAKYGNAFTATLNGIIDLFRKSKPIGVLKEDERLDGKNCLVTGANSGLGFAIATQFAERGATVYMACRSGIPKAGEEVKRLSGSDKVVMMPIDLTDLNSIDSFIDKVSLQGLKFDVAVFNAAMVPSGSAKTASGFDQMFLVNYLSKFKLVNGLLDAGAIVKDVAGPPRIIFVSSESHRTNVPIDIEHLGVFEEYTMGKVIALYGYYKLVMNTYAAELSRRLNQEGVSVGVHALCPGPVNSNIAKAAPGWVQPILKVVFGIFFSSPTKAAKPVLYLACARQLEKRTGVYLHLMQEKQMDAKALDPEIGKKLWEKSSGLLQL